MIFFMQTIAVTFAFSANVCKKTENICIFANENKTFNFKFIYQ